MTDTLGRTAQNELVLDQFKQQAVSYAALSERTAGSRMDPMIEALKPLPTDRVLDVGCGSGHFAISIAPLVAHVTGVDLTPEMLGQARAVQTRAGLANIEWKQADSADLPIDDASFDIVTSRAMLHHAADPQATLAEMRRVCAPGGRIAVQDLTPAASKAPAFDAIEWIRDPSHRQTYTSDAFRAMGAALSLREVDVQTLSPDLPLEATLATSFPTHGALDRVKELYRRDAARGADTFGLRTRLIDDALWVTYPLTLIIWACP